MIISKDNQGNWTPTAGGTGTFIGTKAAFDAVKDTLPVNTVAYITDDGNGDLQPVDAVTNGDMHPVTSNAVYDALSPDYTSATNIYIKSKDSTAESDSWTMTETVTVPSTGWYRILTAVNNISAGIVNNSIWVNIGSVEISKVSQTSSAGWTTDADVVVVPIKKDTVITVGYNLPAGMRGDVIIQRIS